MFNDILENKSEADNSSTQSDFENSSSVAYTLQNENKTENENSTPVNTQDSGSAYDELSSLQQFINPAKQSDNSQQHSNNEQNTSANSGSGSGGGVKFGIWSLIITALVTMTLCTTMAFVMFNNFYKEKKKNAAITEAGSTTAQKTQNSSAHPSQNITYGNGNTNNTSTESGQTDAEAGSAKSIVQKCSRSIVSINVELVTQSFFGESVSTASGSGVIFTQDGYIVTCAHVISGANKVTVTLQDGTTYDASLVGSDSRTDLAVIKIESTNLPAAQVGDSSSYSVGDEIYAIGNPLGEFATTVTDGIISGTDRTIKVDGNSMKLMQTNAAINPGNSGGGLFSATTGELIGIVNAKSYGLEIEGLGFAIPTSSAMQTITDLMDKGYVTGRPYIGITMEQHTYSLPFGSSTSGYVSIVEVIQNSPAQAAGLKSNDIILSLGGKEITSTDDVSAVLNDYNAGDKVDMVVLRNNQEYKIQITLGESSRAE